MTLLERRGELKVLHSTFVRWGGIIDQGEETLGVVAGVILQRNGRGASGGGRRSRME